MRVVRYAVEGETFRADKPQPWSEGQMTGSPMSNLGVSYGLHPDGERLVVALPSQAPPTTQGDKIVFVFNFFDELRRIAPISRK